MKNHFLLVVAILTTAVSILACRVISNASTIINSYNLSPNELFAKKYMPLNTKEFEAVIVPQELASDFIYNLNGERTTTHWTPSKDEVLELEEHIKAYINELPPETLMPLTEYKRQYAGAVVNNHRLIYGNFFCQAFEVDWHKEPLVVMDGGNCFFQVVYDLDTQDFASFNINGEG